MAVRRSLTEPAPRDQLTRIGASVRDSDPYGLDLQLALYMCYELHYRGFAGVDPTWEWNPGLLHLRGQLERAFLAGVRRDVGPIEPGQTAEAEMDDLSIESADGTGPVLLAARQRNVGADARILRASIAVSPQGGRPARLGDPPSHRPGQGIVRRGRIRRIRRRARRKGSISSCSPTC